MHISDFDYELPANLIAQYPTSERGASRMLVVKHQQEQFSDQLFIHFPSFLQPGDCLVTNNTRVFPARLLGRRKGFSAHVEFFLLRNLGKNCWETLVKPGRALKLGAKAVWGDTALEATVLEILPNGHRIVELKSNTEESVEQLIERFGTTPLPPYIKRTNTDSLRLDQDTYQTVYATVRGAIAAPTAGLHFTPAIMDTIRKQGVDIAMITHHVGYGTFQPVRVTEIEEHTIEREQFIISPEAAEKINNARAKGGRVIAVGTTTTRALETAANMVGEVKATNTTTDLFIYPGYQFKVIDALLTNFHLPQSSLLMLVAAFAGRELVLAAYQHAVKVGYRFYSYGDCMFLC